MKFNKILHPEIVLDRRGPELLRSIYRAAKSNIGHDPVNGFYCKIPPPNFVTPSQMEDLQITWKYSQEQPQVYHVPKAFCEAMGKLDKEIPVDALPDRFFAYFSFAENSVWDGEDWVQGAYIFIGPPNETPLKPEHRGEHNKVFWGVYYTQAPPKDPNDVLVSRLVADLAPEKFSAIIDRLPKDSGGPVPQPDAFIVALNLVLYVNSINCDLVPARPVKDMKPAEKKERIRKGELINQCTVPITLVSWDYQHKRTYTKEGTWVDTFPRWQRCGPQNSQVKLIYVTPHERKFKNVKGKDEIL